MEGKDVRFTADYSIVTRARRKSCYPVMEKARLEGYQAFLLYPATIKVSKGHEHTLFQDPVMLEEFLVSRENEESFGNTTRAQVAQIDDENNVLVGGGWGWGGCGFVCGWGGGLVVLVVGVVCVVGLFWFVGWLVVCFCCFGGFVGCCGWGWGGGGWWLGFGCWGVCWGGGVGWLLCWGGGGGVGICWGCGCWGGLCGFWVGGGVFVGLWVGCFGIGVVWWGVLCVWGVWVGLCVGLLVWGGFCGGGVWVLLGGFGVVGGGFCGGGFLGWCWGGGGCGVGGGGLGGGVCFCVLWGCGCLLCVLVFVWGVGCVCGVGWVVLVGFVFGLLW
uniref:Uncharacterized protein n=1 Tax=Knipowitschia caucasica TaxID=637954 RepID=A0AAV2IVG2_KNICA